MIRVTDVRYVPARPEDRTAGLLGFASLTLPGDLRLDGITVRRTREGRYALSFPARRDAQGNDHPIVRPLTPVARAAIEDAVLGELDRRGFITRTSAEPQGLQSPRDGGSP